MCEIMEKLIKKEKMEYAREIALDLLRKGKVTKEDLIESFDFSLEEADELEREAEVVPC